MGKWRYDGDDPRTYPDLSLEVNPGDVVDFDGDPPGDGRWSAAPTEKTTEKE